MEEMTLVEREAFINEHAQKLVELFIVSLMLDNDFDHGRLYKADLQFHVHDKEPLRGKVCVNIALLGGPLIDQDAP